MAIFQLFAEPCVWCSQHEVTGTAANANTGVSLPLIALAAIVAGRSIERLHTAYLFAQGHPADDLTQAHINVPLELRVWGIVLGIVVVVSFVLRFWHRSKRQVA